MLFSAGMGIGLVFYGAAEPLSHFAISAPEADPGSIQALQDSLKYCFFHWGFSAWAVYAVVALALAYFKFRKREKSLLSVTLKPLFGTKMNGGAGHVIDIVTCFATVAGVATSLGLGAMQINGGLSYLFGIPYDATVQLIIIAITTMCFIASAVSGINKGVKVLSNLNVIIAIGLMAAALVVGPAVQIMNAFVNATGAYLQDFLRLCLRTAPYSPEQSAWIGKWTLSLLGLVDLVGPVRRRAHRAYLEGTYGSRVPTGRHHHPDVVLHAVVLGVRNAQLRCADHGSKPCGASDRAGAVRNVLVLSCGDGAFDDRRRVGLLVLHHVGRQRDVRFDVAFRKRQPDATS